MARLLAISSQVAYGPVGLTALVPALQAAGHEVLAIPTVTLSNHPGHGRPAGFRTAPEELRGLMEGLSRLGVLETVDAVLTGYFASAAQIEAVQPFLRTLKAARPSLAVLVDPVAGDGDALYVPEEVATAIRALLLPLATIATPNAFELAWLTGLPVHDEQEAIAAARILAVGEVLATSVPADAGRIATLLVAGDGVHRHVSVQHPQVPHGTGDFLAGLYLAARLTMPPEPAFRQAMRQLDHAIALSAGSPVLAVARALHGGDAPSKQAAP